MASFLYHERIFWMIIFVAWKKQMEHTTLFGVFLVGTFLVVLLLMKIISFMCFISFSIAKPSSAL